jgi:hypothetical protein
MRPNPPPPVWLKNDKGACQVAGDCLRCAALNVAALHHVHQLAVAQQANGRRGRRKTAEVAASFLRGVTILAGKYRDDAIRASAAAQGSPHTRAHSAGSTAANRVHHDHGGAFLLHCVFHVGGGSRFLDPCRSQFFAHRRDHHFRIHSGSSMGSIHYFIRENSIS